MGVVVRGAVRLLASRAGTPRAAAAQSSADHLSVHCRISPEVRLSAAPRLLSRLRARRIKRSKALPGIKRWPLASLTCASAPRLHKVRMYSGESPARLAASPTGYSVCVFTVFSPRSVEHRGLDTVHSK